MSIFGKKLSKFAHKVGHKFSTHNMAKFGNKVAHAAHKGLHVANKIVTGVERASKLVAKVADKVKGIPVVAGAAATIALGAKGLGKVAHLGHKGVAGLEKKVAKAEKLGQTIHKAKGNIQKGDYHIDTIKKEAGNVISGANKLRR
jgi:hypothetical protein|tara:strand:+ start:649 stop:1083 length:435 start_codon:yes stop_codon:yes gene_type:complete